MANELDALRSATAGLLYASDSDEPFDVLTLPAAPTAKDALVAAGKAKGKIAEQPFDEFFADLADANNADKFAALKQTIDTTLSDVKIFRLGEVEVAIYIIGKTTNGQWAALHTKSIES